MPKSTRLAVFLIAFGSCQVSHALSTVTQLTSTNMQSFPFVAVKVVSDGANHKKFEVSFTAPPDLYVSDSITGQLEVRAGEELIARSSFGGGRPTAWSKYSERAGNQRPLRFTFTVRREHLATSKFSISHEQPDFSRFDNYWLYLKDFVNDP